MFSHGILSKLLGRLLADRSVPVGRWGGVRFELHPGSLFLAVAITVSLARAFGSRIALDFGPLAGSPPVLGAAVIVLGILVSVFLHEAAHAWTGRSRGLDPRRIVVHLLGGTTEFAHETVARSDDRSAVRTPDAVTEYQVAVAGPLASLFLAVVFTALFFRIAPSPPSSWAVLVCMLLAFVNLGYGVITFFPAYPLDGGRALGALLWRVSGNRARGTRMAAEAARTFAIASSLAGISLAVAVHPAGLLLSLVGVYVGEFSAEAAGQARRAERVYRAESWRRAADAAGAPHRSGRSQAAAGNLQVTKAQPKSTTMAGTLASTPKDPPVQSDRLDDVANRTGSS